MSSVIVVVLGVALILGGIIFSLNHHRSEDIAVEGCKTEVKTMEIGPGNEFLPAGQVEVEMGYYNCHQGERDDIALVKTPGREDPTFLAIKMIPGDTFEVRPASKPGLFHIHVNMSDMTNSKGDKYELNDRGVAMIKLYENNFKNGISKNVYFAFTDDPIGGGLDSTRFGPMMPERLIGKVLKKGEKPSESTQTAKAEEKPKEEAPAAAATTTTEDKSTDESATAPAPAKPAAAKKPHATKKQ